MSWKNFVKDYLRFGKMDRIGLLSLLALGMLVYLLPLFFKKKSLEFSVRERAVLASAMSQDSSSGSKNGSFSNEEAGNEYEKSVYEPGTKNFQAGELFSFDPNTLNIEGWRRLGLTERTARTIEKYISKGGHFYKAEDLKKIWGLPPEFYERVRRYITIAPAPNQYSSYQKPAYDKGEKNTIIININEADTTAFIALPGIGSKLASRIINFREKLGGFYSVEQIKETYGLPDSVFQNIKSRLASGGDIKKLHINTATKEELKVHPYIKWNLANAIVEYRNQHGAFKDLNELKNISVIDESTFNKISPYLSL